MPQSDDELDLDGVDQLDPEETNQPPNEPDEEPEQPDDFEGEADEVGEEVDQPDLAEAHSQERPDAGRASARIKSLDRRLRDAEEREKAANRRIDELLKARQPQPAAPDLIPKESAEQRAQRRSSLTPEERVSEDLRESEARITQQMRGMQLSNWDQNDRTLFESKAVNDPRYKRFMAKVEQEFQRIRSEGGGAAREAILRYLIGDEYLARPIGSSKQRADAGKRLKANTTRPANTRGDTNAGKRERGGGKTLEERLSDVPL